MADADLLRSHGLKATAPRMAVLDAVEALGGHPDAEAIAQHARVQLGGISTQAVYDNLRALTEAGLMRRIEPAGSPARYETRIGDNHHHVVCRRCGATQDIDCVVGDAPCLEPSSTGGFSVEQAEVTFWGLCPACQSSEGSAR